ncbi:hypothetical protein [Thiomonas sp.]|uniref:hypothetical protein n=1 Tax=Thiomonas sp. TaxID=2047785 RepID=UPI002623B21D|nr:hypothetical protein [Thiomonas sp.]
MKPEIIAMSRLRGEFSDPRKAVYFDLRIGPATVQAAWDAHGGWRVEQTFAPKPMTAADLARRLGIDEAAASALLAEAAALCEREYWRLFPPRLRAVA